jgi:hypothetical protein
MRGYRTVLATAVVSASALIGCATDGATDEPSPAGLYGGGPYYEPRYGARTAYVGLPFESAPLADCRPGDWSMDRARIVTGALPPGLAFGGANGNRIVGIPTRAGDWYLTVEFSNVQCEGSTYGPYTQTLNIKTEGSSVPQSVR